VAKGDFDAGTNKCNLFVSDMVKSSGAEPPQRYKFGIIPRGPVTAGELGDASKTLLSIVSAGDAKIGDVVGFKKDFSDATDHTVIFAGDVGIIKDGTQYGPTAADSSPGTIGAGSDAINHRSMNYLDSHDYKNPVYRTIEE
jgi:hypothetical protein